MIWVVCECIQTVVRVGLFLWFLRVGMTGKKQEKTGFLLAWGIISAILILPVFLPRFRGNFLAVIALFLYSFCCFSDARYRKWFYFLMLCLIALCGKGILSFVFYLILGNSIITIYEPSLWQMLFSFSYNLMMWLIMYLIGKKQGKYPIRSRISSYLLPGLLVFVIVGEAGLLFLNFQKIPVIWAFVVSLLLLMVLGITLILYYVLSDFSLQLDNYRLKDKIMKTQEEQTLDIQVIYDQMLKIRHDIRAYIQDYHEYSRDHSSDEFTTYPEMLAKKHQTLPHTGNNILDSIIFIKTAKMEKNDIEFRWKELHYTGGLYIADEALGALISNMLDNAVEEEIKIADQIEKKYVYLGFFYSEAGMTIICENPVEKEKTSSASFFMSLKKEPGHGLGISIMKMIVENAKGQIDFLKKEDVFQVIVQLPLRETNYSDIQTNQGKI